MTLGEMKQYIRAAVVARSARPVVHENGFIQLPLDPVTRLHVWPDGPVQRQKTNSPIHDHRFAFESYVLKGMLEHVEYEWWQDTVQPTHRLFQVVQRVDAEGRMGWGVLTATDETGFLKVHGRVKLPAGGAYTFGSRRFHASIGDGLTATVMIKRKNYPEYTPRVLAPLGQMPDNDFNREEANDPELLWGYIERAIR